MISIKELELKYQNLFTLIIDDKSYFLYAAYLTAYYCAALNKMKDYPKQMKYLEETCASKRLRKRVSSMEVSLLNQAERAANDFNVNKFNPPKIKTIEYKGFGKLAV